MNTHPASIRPTRNKRKFMKYMYTWCALVPMLLSPTWSLAHAEDIPYETETTWTENLLQLNQDEDQATSSENTETSTTVLQAPSPAPNIPTNPHSIPIRGIEIGMSKQNVIDTLGEPARTDRSEYGFEWSIYNHDYKSYVQIGIKDDRVVALYTPVALWQTAAGITDGTPHATVIQTYGEPIPYILKGNTRYHLNYGKKEYGTYKLGEHYVTFFYDQHRGNIVTSIQVIEAAIEHSLDGYYAAEPSTTLLTAFEKQIFDLANASRIKLGKDALEWDERISETARKHSQDMATRNFFDHTNLDQLTPFDRMQKDGIRYLQASENIAAGQASAIFAHESWMNSLGHRKNILANIKKLGVGVAAGGTMHYYYTQNFFTPRP